MSSPDDFDAPVGLAARAMAARPATYLEGLNPAQRRAVEAVDGPVLMLAGAGTGKTRALMARVAHLLSTGRAQSNEVLAVTFTNKAAASMKIRLSETPYNFPGPFKWLGTFHAICAKLLRQHAELVGLKSNFTILDTDDQKRQIKKLVEADNKRLFDPLCEATGTDDMRYLLRALVGIISRWKNYVWLPDKIPAAELAGNKEIIRDLYAAYQESLIRLNAVDFDDLLMHVVTIFQQHPDVLEQYQRWFKYILVDEYQDTNVAQYLWLRLLAAGHKNICCVGDDDQSIYGWRGAEVGNILRFEQDFPGATVVKLEQNYRSTHHILGAASAVISANEGRLGKTLWTEKNEGDKVRLIGHWDGEEEARWIGDEAEAMQRGTRNEPPMSLDHMAILVRASHQMRAFEDRFLTIGLPYRVIGGPRFYERLEIRDAMAYFRITVQPEDDLAFERIINTPRRGVGNIALQNIQMAAREHRLPLLETTRMMLEAGQIKGKAKGALQVLVDGFSRWARVAADETASHVELAEVILEESGYTDMWQKDKSPDAPGRLENLKELVKALEQFENLQGFLEHIALIMDNASDEDEEKLTIMTLHGAKGLEFPAVFLPGWEEGLFPSQRSMDESGVKGLEEERRLAYVGITRAEELCTISFAANRRVYGQWQSQLPSRFIDELPEEHVEVLTPPGLYGGGYGAAGMGTSEAMEDKAERADAYNSPGWRRMQARQQERGMGAPREASKAVIDVKADASFTQGERVFHQKFGYGYVMGVEGDKLDIEFERAGSKKIVARFVVAADRADDVPF